MAYEKQTWVDNVTPATDDRLNHIEDGIEQVYADVDETLEPYVSHDGSPAVGDLLKVKSLNPLIVERQAGPQERLFSKYGAIHPMDDEFDDGVIDPVWIETHVMNPTATTVMEGAGVLSIKHNGATDTTTQPTHAWMKPIQQLSYPFVIEGAFRCFRRYATNYMMWGLIMTDGLLSTSKAMWMMPYSSTATGGNAHTLSVRYGTRSNVATDALSGSQTWEHPSGPLYQRLTAVSADLWRGEYSVDGVQWVQVPTADWSYAMTPTHVGFAMGSWGTASGQKIGSVEYFRVYQPPHERGRDDLLGMVDSVSASYVFSVSDTNPMFVFDDVEASLGFSAEALSESGLLDDVTPEIIP